LREQVKVEGLAKLSNGSVNKYLQCYSALFTWAVSNQYVSDNPFKGMRLKDLKKGKREQFTKAEIATMLSEINKGKNGLANNDRKYWGLLIAIYTGARLNEIASLTVNDIKRDDNGIWYFDITDEEEDTKQLKTEASKRIVPIHSELIRLGLLDYVEKARDIVNDRRKPNEPEPRLLYDLVYRERAGWGRKLGDWVNNTFLVKLGLKVPMRKTLHSLRHSFITSLSVAGVEGAYIKSIVGHEADTVTSGVYTHYGLDHLPAFKDAIEKLKYKKI
jgi:integrase